MGLIGVISMVLRGFEFPAMKFWWDDNAYGSLVWTMEGDDASVLHATDAACTDAIGALGGRPPLGLMLFDCAARRGVLGDGAEEREAARVARHAGGAPLAGLFTFGEIARTRGIHGFHNQTLVVLAVA